MQDRKTKLFIALGILAAIILAAAIYTTFVPMATCQSPECFQRKMVDCSQVVYVNEDAEASWQYTINGVNNDECVVNVRLLMAKKGEIGINELEGYDMDCSYPLGMAAYPEKDLTKCHGLLKEELQNIIINKLHAYVLENFGKFEEGLKTAV